MEVDGSDEGESELGVHDETGPGAAAALVIRVWQDTPGAAMKARITKRPDLSTDEETTTTATTPEQVFDEVREWLDGFLGRSRGSRVE
jgi:hypothetical protein